MTWPARKRKARDGLGVETDQLRDTEGEHARRGDLQQRAGHGDAPHRAQVGEREMQADAEQRQHHADLRQFLDGMRVGDQAGRRRTDHNAGQQIADDRRQSRRACGEAADIGDGQADQQGDDKLRRQTTREVDENGTRSTRCAAFGDLGLTRT